jgi:hypothetical protein
MSWTLHPACRRGAARGIAAPAPPRGRIAQPTCNGRARLCRELHFGGRAHVRVPRTDQSSAQPIAASPPFASGVVWTGLPSTPLLLTGK